MDSQSNTCSYVFDPEEWENVHEKECPVESRWECPHPQFSDETSECIFHLSDDEGRSLDSNEIATEFVAAIQRGGQKEKQFIGVEIPNLDLNNCHLETKDNHPIQITCASIGQLTLSNVDVKQPVTITETNIDEIDVTNARFAANSTFRISHSQIDEGARFSNSQFQKVFLTHVEFSAEVDFSYSQFEEVHIFDSTFHSEIQFPWISCEGRYHITNSVVEADSNFSRSEFKKDTRFRATEFHGSTAFQHCRFAGYTFSDSSFHVDVDFSNSKFSDTAVFVPREETRLTNADFNQVVFRGNAVFHSVNFSGDSYFNQAKFYANAIFNSSEFSGDTDFSYAHFQSQLQMADVSHEGEFRFESAQCDDLAIFNGSHFADTAYFTGSEFRRIDFEDSAFEQLVSFSYASIENLLFEIEPTENQVFVDCKHTKINRGRIVHPEDNYAIFDLPRATFGDIELLGETEASVFDPFQFIETEFDGFDFKRYRRDLEELAWSFDTASVDQGRLPESVRSSEEFLDEIVSDSVGPLQFGSPEGDLQPDLSRPNEYLETTYQRAKNGAQQVGDQKAAAEFYIKEMEYRRSRYLSEMIATVPTLALLFHPGLIFHLGKLRKFPHDFSGGRKLFSRWFLNYILAISSGYGERLRYVVGWSFGIIIVGMLIYPTNWVGGIRRVSTPETDVFTYGLIEFTGRVTQYSDLWVGIQRLIDIWQVSLYYSIVTFTTLGSGTYSPGSEVGEFITAIQSFTGAFLIALFVYSLGKQVVR